MQAITPTLSFLNLNRIPGKRHNKAMKYEHRTREALKTTELSPYEAMRAMQDLCAFYYPTYCKLNHRSTKAPVKLPYEPCAPMDLSWKGFTDIGEWLVALYQGKTKSSPDTGPSTKEIEWVFAVTAARVKALKDTQSADLRPLKENN